MIGCTSESSDLLHFSLLEKVADAVIPYRPDWVIRISLKQSDQLIEQTQNKLYPIAARWLERAKKVRMRSGGPILIACERPTRGVRLCRGRSRDFRADLAGWAGLAGWWPVPSSILVI